MEEESIPQIIPEKSINEKSINEKSINEDSKNPLLGKKKILQKNKFKRTKYVGSFMVTLINKEITLPIVTVGKNIKQILEKVIAKNYEGKCIVEGFLKPHSSKIISYSSGLVQSEYIKFNVVFECLICCPVEGMNINCIAKNITKAGIRAETEDDISPVVIFIARDHHNTSKYFSKIKENDKITVRVIGQRYELNDKYISIIAELIEPKKQFKKPRLNII